MSTVVCFSHLSADVCIKLYFLDLDQCPAAHFLEGFSLSGWNVDGFQESVSEDWQLVVSSVFRSVCVNKG